MSIKLPKIFLDSGDPEETKRAKGILGFLDGQTTNPSLLAKNPAVMAKREQGTLTEDELLAEYQTMIQAIDKEVAGPISVETYADWNTKADAMLSQAQEMKKWGRNIYVKFPTIPEGVKAANEFVKSGGKVNMTLVFDQNQAAAVYAATLPGTHPSFISPFIGRWDDRGYQGVDLLKNIQKMYRAFDTMRNERKAHVEVLGASIRTMAHFYACILMGVDAVTIPPSLIQEWVTADERFMPDESYRTEFPGLRSILYKDVPYHDDYTQYPIAREADSLLDAGLAKFVTDWNTLIGKNATTV